MANDVNHVRTALARAVAQRRIPDDAIDEAAQQLAVAKHPIRGIDVCERGICLDYMIDGDTWWQTIPDLVDVASGRLTGIEVFPWGIPRPDILHVRIMQELDVLSRDRG